MASAVQSPTVRIIPIPHGGEDHGKCGHAPLDISSGSYFAIG
jgi:hypothetical protein